MTRSIKGRSKMPSILGDECKQVMHQVLVQFNIPVIWHTQKHNAPSEVHSISFSCFEPDATHDMLDDAIIGTVIQRNFEKGERAEDDEGSSIVVLANERTKDDIHESRRWYDALRVAFWFHH